MTPTTLRHPARQPVHWRPVLRDFDRLMDDFWRGFQVAPRRLSDAALRFRPRFEAVELESEYRVSAEIPGVEVGDLDVKLEDGVLTIQGERRYADAGEADEAAEAAEAAAGRERFERRFRFPGDVREDGVRASYKNGVLTVTLPKAEEARPEVRTVPVEAA